MSMIFIIVALVFQFDYYWLYGFWRVFLVLFLIELLREIQKQLARVIQLKTLCFMTGMLYLSLNMLWS